MKQIFFDYEIGATSPIDTIEQKEGYTADQYVEYCKKYADDDYYKMLENGKITLIPLD